MWPYALTRRLAFVVPFAMLTTAYASAQSVNPGTNGATPTKPQAPTPIFTNAPTPAPSFTKEHPLFVSGDARVYEFYRTNLVQNASNPNRQDFNAGASLHAEYGIPTTYFSVGTTYTGAYPFGLDGRNAGTNPHVDNTLPGFSLSTFNEGYAQYSNDYVQVKLGDQIINTLWANAADSRIMPAAFQGISSSAQFAPGWRVFLDDMVAFEPRTASAFGRYTLLTAPVAGASNSLSPSETEINTNGFIMPGIQFQNRRLAVEVFDYDYLSIANMIYSQVQYNFAPDSPLKPFAGVQYASEGNSAPSVVGKIQNSTVGAQLGVTLARNLTFTAGADYAPWNSETVSLAKCSAATSATTGIFLPSGGTPNCVAHKGGTATIYYGGVASPYTDSYAADPFYTTSITQGMVDRRSAGTSEKLAATWQPLNRQLRLIVSDAFYNYINGAGPNLTREFDADATYFLNKVRPGRYKGLSLRYRYADRTQPTLPYDFKYNRAQLEYDF
jgi:hypothetical protein